MQHSFKAALLGFGVIALAGCVQTTSDLERAGIGALAGCAVGEILEDGECFTGAAVGALGGVLIDDVTR